MAKIIMGIGASHTTLINTQFFKLIVSFAMLVILLNTPSVSLMAFMIWACIIFAAQGGILFGNFNAMAMKPVGHLAGIAAAFVATLSTGLGITLEHLSAKFITAQ